MLYRYIIKFKINKERYTAEIKAATKQHALLKLENYVGDDYKILKMKRKTNIIHL